MDREGQGIPGSWNRHFRGTLMKRGALSPIKQPGNLEFLQICMFFSGSGPKFKNSCKSAGIFEETGLFL
ncbi:hypothetical protein [Paenibacillus faecis]|uniref:hypothetical protein n=1 Tax=Paenibacillus faecis TaxID=862114 RepID=UPI001BD1BB6E|nr:hypothetical protein [Paenibacillus faecis]